MGTDAKGYDWGGFLVTDPLNEQPPLSPSAFGKQLLSVDDATGALTLLGISALAIPDPTGQGGNFLTTDGVNLSWSPAAGGGGTWGSITGTLSSQSDLNTALGNKQPLDSDLTAIAALTTTSFGRSFLDRADAAAGRTLLGLTALSTTTPASGVATFLATPTSANLRAALTDENGTGAALFNNATSPAFNNTFAVNNGNAQFYIDVTSLTNDNVQFDLYGVGGSQAFNVNGRGQVLLADGDAVGGHYLLLNPPAVTANRMLNWPDATGTVALTTNSSGVVDLTHGGTNATTSGGALTNLGATTVGAAMFGLTNPGAITFPQFNANNSVSALSASAFRTAIGAGTSSFNGLFTGLDFTASNLTSIATRNFSDLQNIPVSNLVYVDHSNGSDSTGLIHRADRPFLTCTAAKTEASSGDTIVVLPGTYTDHNLLKNGVDWYFYPGAKVTYTGTVFPAAGIFDDSVVGANAAITSTISGSGVFECGRLIDTTDPAATVLITNANSNVRIRCSEVKTTDTAVQYVYAVAQSGGKLTVSADRIFSYQSSAVWWSNGEMHINCPYILNLLSGNGLQVANGGTPTGACFVNAQKIESAQGVYIEANSAARVWLTAEHIITSDDVALEVEGGVIYVTSQKLENASTGNPTIIAGDGTLYLVTDKVENTLGQAIRFSGATIFAEIYQVLAATGKDILDVTGGDVTLSNTNLVKTTTGDCLAAEDGTIKLNGCYLKSIAGSYPIGDGSTDIINATVQLINTTLVSGSSSSIHAGSFTGDIQSFGVNYANVAAGAGVTFSVGSLSVAAAIPSTWLGSGGAQAYDADLTTWAGITPGTGVATALGVNVGSAGAFVTNPVPVAQGGTNLTSYAVGDLLYASGATTLSKLADVATGNALISGGLTTAPSWGKITTSHTTGIAASGANTDITSLSSSFPLTTPKITTGINDANANSMLAFTATASAVEKATLANAASGGSPLFTLASATLTANTVASGLQLSNTNTASSGNQMYSPAVRWTGQGWKSDATTASRAVDFRAYVVPVQATGNPTALLTFESSINGGAFGNAISFNSSGNLILGGNGIVAGNDSNNLFRLNFGGGSGFAALSDGSHAFWLTYPGRTQLVSGMTFGWSSSSSDAGNNANDIAFARNAAGIVEVNNGSAGTFRDLKLRKLTGVQTAAGTVTSTYSLDVTLGRSWTMTSTASTALAITPTAAGTADQIVTLIITSDATGGDVVTFASPFKPSGTMTLTASKVHTIQFISDGTNLYELSRTTGL